MQRHETVRPQREPVPSTWMQSVGSDAESCRSAPTRVIVALNVTRTSLFSDSIKNRDYHYCTEALFSLRIHHAMALARVEISGALAERQDRTDDVRLWLLGTEMRPQVRDLRAPMRAYGCMAYAPGLCWKMLFQISSTERP